MSSVSGFLINKRVNIDSYAHTRRGSFFSIKEFIMAYKKGVLTVKQRKFCDEYLKDGNASRSALAAGYSKKTAFRTGSENLHKPLIMAEIQKGRDKQSKRTLIDADYVLTSLRSVAERCQTAVPVMVKDDDGKMVESGEYKFDSSGANKSLELLGKHLKLFTDKLEIDASVSVHEQRLAELE